MSQTKVYIVVEQADREAVHIHAVRSSRAKAQEWIEQQDHPSNFEIEDWPVK